MTTLAKMTQPHSRHRTPVYLSQPLQAAILVFMAAADAVASPVFPKCATDRAIEPARSVACLCSFLNVESGQQVMGEA